MPYCQWVNTGQNKQIIQLSVLHHYRNKVSYVPVQNLNDIESKNQII